jgi:hypothetical protein
MPSLQRFASHHCWYYFVRCKNLSDEDMALLSWAKSTVGCPWNTCVLNANALADARMCAAAEKRRATLRHRARPKFRWLRCLGTFLERANRTKVPDTSTAYNFSSFITVKQAKTWFEKAPTEDHPLLKRLASVQPWYYAL